MPQRPKKDRLSLDFPPGGRAQIESVQTRAGAATMTEVVRRAVSLLDLVLDAQAQRGRLVIEYPDGRKEVVRIL